MELDRETSSIIKQINESGIKDFIQLNLFLIELKEVAKTSYNHPDNFIEIETVQGKHLKAVHKNGHFVLI